MENVWQSLSKPVIALAPLSGITDSAFRRICRKNGADLVYSELASVSALVFNPRSTLEMLRFDPSERPYIVQLFGSNPEHFAAAARLVSEEVAPDGIDINFGCPVPKVTRSGAGAALMTDLPLAKEVVEAVIANTHLPVSIKARTRVKDVELGHLLDRIAGLDVKALMVHGRSYAQRFSGPVDHEGLRNARAAFRGVFLANGGAVTPDSAIALLHESGADGIGIARGALGNPWIFREVKARLAGAHAPEVRIEERIETALEHARLSHELKGPRGILQMRKHLCWYIQSIPDAGRVRKHLAETKNLEEVRDILEGIRENFPPRDDPVGAAAPTPL